VSDRDPAAAARNLTWHHGLDAATRASLSGLRGATVWLTGLSGSGKSTVAVLLERMLVESGRPAPGPRVLGRGPGRERAPRG
jgi:ABC-type bacteriocin/lantibiotic exporter with double-glycine peptidase domain